MLYIGFFLQDTSFPRRNRVIHCRFCTYCTCSIFIFYSVKRKERNLDINNKYYLCFIFVYLQRNENRLASLDPLILQEFDFLKNFVARVVSLRPNMLLVEKTVSRIAQDMLLQHGITLVLNVKPVSQ